VFGDRNEYVGLVDALRSQEDWVGYAAIDDDDAGKHSCGLFASRYVPVDDL